MREVVIVRVYFFYTPLLFDCLRTCRDRTVWRIFVVYGSKDVFPVAYKLEQSVMGQKMCFDDSYVILRVRTKFF